MNRIIKSYVKNNASLINLKYMYKSIDNVANVRSHNKIDMISLNDEDIEYYKYLSVRSKTRNDEFYFDSINFFGDANGKAHYGNSIFVDFTTELALMSKLKMLHEIETLKLIDSRSDDNMLELSETVFTNQNAFFSLLRNHEFKNYDYVIMNIERYFKFMENHDFINMVPNGFNTNDDYVINRLFNYKGVDIIIDNYKKLSNDALIFGHRENIEYKDFSFIYKRINEDDIEHILNSFIKTEVKNKFKKIKIV